MFGLTKLSQVCLTSSCSEKGVSEMMSRIFQEGKKIIWQLEGYSFEYKNLFSANLQKSKDLNSSSDNTVIRKERSLKASC
jgi:hypothetical protein